MRKPVIAGILIMAIVLGAVLYQKFANHSSSVSGVEVTWDLLGQMDYITGKASSELTALNDQEVKIPGFMVPLEDSQKHVTEFLLVPSPQACIHVPPPPPNQMVYVKMNNDLTEVAFGPIWVHGKLKLTSKKHMYGESSFEMVGDFVEPYR